MLYHLLCFMLLLSIGSAYSSFGSSSMTFARGSGRIKATTTSSSAASAKTMSTTVAPPRPDTETERTTRRQEEDKESYDEFDIRKQGPLEYLEDDLEQSRDMNDPFHILLLGETYLKPKVSINYVSGSLQFVLEMPYEDAVDAAMFAKDNGMSCLGTWSREECLGLGKELQMRDLCVRVVPFVPGGQRGWQANKDASDNSAAAGGNFIDADYTTETD